MTARRFEVLSSETSHFDGGAQLAMKIKSQQSGAEYDFTLSGPASAEAVDLLCALDALKHVVASGIFNEGVKAD